MKNKDTQRGMKKWAPFDALEGHSSYIQKVKEKHLKEEKPSLSDNQIEDINYALSNYINHFVKVHYFDDTHHFIVGYFNKVNQQNLEIIIDKKHISFNSLIEIISLDIEE